MIDATVRHAVTKRLCPRCLGTLRLNEGDGGEFIQCTRAERHRYELAAIWDCPTIQRIDILEREGQMVVRGLRQGQETGRRPDDDMADLYNLPKGG